MNVARYIAVGVGVLVILSIYGCIYIMTSEKKKKENPGIIFSIYEFLSKKIEHWKKEKCVMCGNPTAYARNIPTIQRVGYMEGAGQLCMNCNERIYPRSAAER